MAEYIINFTDPVVPGIQIPTKAVNGPGEAQTASTLRLFGENYVGWGESVNENMLRMAEHFAGATAPINPVSGQLWLEVDLYYRNTTTSTFYLFNLTPTDANFKTWQPITVVSQLTAPASTIGSYWFDTSTNILKLFSSSYNYVPASWINRSMVTGAVAPTGAPRKRLRMFNANVGVAGEWGSLLSEVLVSDSLTAPTDNSVGALRYAPTTDTWSVWNGTKWSNITVLVSDSTAAPVGNTIGSLRYSVAANTFSVWNGTAWITLINAASAVFTANVNANGFKIISVADATAGTDALNRQTGDARYVAGVTGTSPVVSSGGLTPAISMPAATSVAAGHMTAVQVSKLDGIAPGATVGVTNVTGTSPVVSSGGLTPAISMPAATSVAAGHMTAAYASKLNSLPTNAVSSDIGHNNIGSFVFAFTASGNPVGTGVTVPGSVLTAAGVHSYTEGGYAGFGIELTTTLVGTWRCLGAGSGYQGLGQSVTLFQRIA